MFRYYSCWRCGSRWSYFCVFLFLKIGPIEHRQTKIDGRRIESENSVQFRFVPDCLTIKYLRFSEMRIFPSLAKILQSRFWLALERFSCRSLFFRILRRATSWPGFCFWPGRRGILDRTKIPRNGSNSHVVKFRFHGLQKTHYITQQPPYCEPQRGDPALNFKSIQVKISRFYRYTADIWFFPLHSPFTSGKRGVLGRVNGKTQVAWVYSKCLWLFMINYLGQQGYN